MFEKRLLDNSGCRPSIKLPARLGKAAAVYGLAFAIAAAGGKTLAASPQERGGQDEKVDFNRQIRPILSRNCSLCHGPDEKDRQAGLRLDIRDGATALHDGRRAIAPGDTQHSELLRRVASSDPDERMPPPSSNKTLQPQEIELLRRWIEQGAPYTPHWAYVKPLRPKEPAVSHSSWPRNAIDRFLLARLDAEKLQPSPEADRTTLVRRLTLDLTGLPPTLQEVDQFVADPSPDSYEKLVDHLLAREAFGEHWARMWLDLARYADSAGYVSDVPREIWAYRDYVIRSLNANKPWNELTIEQVAGDLLPHPTDEQLIATAFHRNTQTNNEGGSDREEYRNVAIVDRVNTTMAVWMGTTMACAQCHDHKYDPITQKEYFQFFAFFNNTADADRADEQPVYPFYTAQQKQLREKLAAEITALDPQFQPPQFNPQQFKPPAVKPKKKAAPKKPALKKADQKIADQNKADPAAAAKLPPPHGADQVAAAKVAGDNTQRLADLKAQLKAIQAHTVPIQKELTGKDRRTTHIEYRGNFLDLGPAVVPAVPAAFHPLPKNMPADRLALAYWLVDDNNPLVARVMVNRLWERLFGIGLVATSEDFGSQGDMPVNPELLDWLAREWIESHWNFKHMVRLMVTTAAYRQSSRVEPELAQRDAENRLLARGPRFRLDAEAIRDQSLAASGLLCRKMYGPSARPPQPSFGLSAAFGGGMDWTNSEGEDRYRRGLYTSWRRTNPYPSLSTFDAASREVCTLRRSRTNTPLQALVTLNDPVYVEAAQALGRRMMSEGGDSPADKIRYGFRLCLARSANEAETARLVKLYEVAREHFRTMPAGAKAMAATSPGDKADKADKTVDRAAWAVVGNVLLNLDEMFMRP